MFLVATIAVGIASKHIFKAASVILFSNIFVHSVLDSFVGGIYWLYSHSQKSYHIMNVPARYD